MDHQAKNRGYGSTLQVSIILAVGIAMCTWLGSNMNESRHVLQTKAAIDTSMMQPVKMPNAGTDALMATSGIDDPFIIEMEKESNATTATEKEEDTVRAAIYTRPAIPGLKSANRKQVRITDIII